MQTQAPGSACATETHDKKQRQKDDWPENMLQPCFVKRPPRACALLHCACCICVKKIAVFQPELRECATRTTCVQKPRERANTRKSSRANLEATSKEKLASSLRNTIRTGPKSDPCRGLRPAGREIVQSAQPLRINHADSGRGLARAIVGLRGDAGDAVFM